MSVLVGSPLGAIASSTDKGRMEKKPRVGGWTWRVALAPWGANRAANPSDSDRARLEALRGAVKLFHPSRSCWCSQ